MSSSLGRALDLLASRAEPITLACGAITLLMLFLYALRRMGLSRATASGFAGRAEEVIYAESLDVLFEAVQGRSDPMALLWKEFFAWMDRPWEFISSAMRARIHPVEEKVKGLCLWLELWALFLVFLGATMALAETARAFQPAELSLGEAAGLAVRGSASRLASFLAMSGLSKLASASLEGRLELFKLRVQREMALAEALKFKAR